MSGRWLRIAPERQLHAVADDVILPGEDVERVLGLQRFHPALRHREGIVAEVDLLLLVIIFEHREVDDPAEAERALLDQVELLGDAGPGEAGELGGLVFLAGGEEDAVVGAKAHRLGQLVHALGAVVLGDRAAPFAALAGGVAEAGEAFAARPFVHLVEEFAALVGGARRRDRADHRRPSRRARRTGRSPSRGNARRHRGSAAGCAGRACRCHI